MTGWQATTTEYLINEGLLKIGDGYRAKNSEFTSTGFPFARAGNINNGFLFSNADHLPTQYKEVVGDKISETGDVVFTSKGTVGRFGFVTEKIQKFVYSPQLCFWRSLKRDKIISKFIYYWMHGDEFVGQADVLKGQTDMADYVNLADQRRMKITLPPPSEQKAIAAVLSSLDDKIDLLHRQNATLEAMAEALFRQWFVVEAKEEWESTHLSYFGKIVCGKTPSKANKAFFDGEIPFIKIPDMHGNIFIDKTSDTLTKEGASSQVNKYLPPDSICVSCIATVGLVAITKEVCQTNQQINTIIPLHSFYRYYLFFHLRLLKDELENMASGGTATPNLNTGDFSRIEILSPLAQVLKSFDEIVHPLFAKIRSNQSQIHTLEKLRDTLLPKLMSGEVRVQF